MKSKSTLSKGAMIYGIVLTSLMFLAFGSKLIVSLVENGVEELKEMARALIHWHDDPTAFFIFYIIGYAVVWWKDLWGSIIIMVVSLLVILINIDNGGFILFGLPTFAVGLLYFLTWYERRKKN